MAQRTPEECRRHNHVHAAYVDAGLKIDGILGRDRAISFLLREGVSAEVVERIFSRPEQQRARRDDMTPHLRRMLCVPDAPIRIYWP